MSDSEPNADRSAATGSAAVDYQRRGPIALVRFSGVGPMNLLTVELLKELNETFERFVVDDAIVAVITGEGGRAFSAGADLADYIPRLTTEGLSVLIDDPAQRFFSRVFKPIVAAVEGHCIAGGLEILLGTDIRIAAQGATFGLGEVRWGVVPVAGSHVRLPGQIPWAIAMQLLLTGRPIDARRAYEVGLVNEVVPDGGALDRALEVAEMIAANGPLALRTAKEIAVRALGLESGFELEAELAHPVFESGDAVEGPRAFVEKRAPRFEGK
jgi:enoyl-CoA hydratase